MEKKSLYIFKLNTQGYKVKFPDSGMPAKLGEYTYTAQRMAGTPTLTATLNYPVCLDDEWTGEEFVEFRGERYYVGQVPTSSKDNKSAMYKHELQFVSERIVLENVYFMDVVTAEADTYHSNSTSVKFMGDINEFVGRLNASMAKSDIGYSVVIDEDITSEIKLVSLDNVYLAEALQSIYTIYELPYYFVGKVCHIGYTENVISTPFEYKKGLISIKKTNANYKIVNRVTGFGSSDNIPFYYPNDDEKGTIERSQNLMPSIYRESEGAERFYNALNDTYKIPDTNDYYSFKNPYSAKKVKEIKVDFSDIKPTIEGVTNASGQLFGEIADIAFDQNDSDELGTGSGNNVFNGTDEYVHSYFYIKLHIYNGDYGFNLFEQGLEGGTAVINMTTGTCASCAFEIGVTYKDSEPQRAFNPVLVDSSGNLPAGDFEQKVTSQTSQYVERQQNTYTNSVWIAVKKDNTTFGVVMPNATNNYKPSIGDKFVITGIKMPKSLVLAAEKRLDEALIKYMSENNDEKFTFSVNFSRVFLADNIYLWNILNENARIYIKYNNREYLMYVNSFTCKADKNYLYDISVELTDKLSANVSALRSTITEIAGDIIGNIQGGGYGGDILAKTSKHYIRKDQPDSAKYLVKFLKGIHTGIYTPEESGGMIDEKGNAELNKLLLRSGLVTKEDFKSDDFILGALGTGFGLLKKDSSGKSYLEVDKLYARIKATFSELEIRKLTYAGGNYVFSPAGVECIKVEDVISAYRLYFNANDGDKAVENLFRTDDLVQCRESNVKSGVDGYTGNRYYWRRCVGTGADYIDLSKTDCDVNSDIPMEGDTVVTIGNRSNPERQNAIVISVYGEGSPSFMQYTGINNFTLEGKAKTIISPQLNQFTGKLLFTSGQDAETVIGNADKKADAAASDAANAQAKADSAYSLSEKVSNSVDTILTGLIPDLQNQIDGNIQAWDGSEVPTLDNYPANQWTTPEEKERHIGDTYDYFFTQDGQQVSKRYKFRKVGDTFEWTLLADSEGARLEVELRKTLGIANSKNSISYGSRPQPPYSIDDIWIDTNKCMYVCRVQREQDATGLESDWELVNDTQVRLRNMASDGVISKEEKPTYRNTLEQIKKEYATYNTIITSVSKTALTSAYNNIVNYMTATLKVTEDSDTNITESQRNEFNTYLAAWYSSVTEFTNLIAGEEAGKIVDGIQIGSQNLISKKMMLKWNEKNKDIAVWGQDEDGIYLDVTPKLLFDNFSVSNDILNPIFDLNFKVNTQYVLAIEWKSKTTEATLKEGLIILIRYTDGGKSDRLILTNHTTSKTTVYIVTQPGRTIQKISSSYGYNVHALIYNISLIEGNKPLQGFPVAEEDQTGANNVNLADGTKEFTVTAGTDNWGYHKLYVSKIKPNTVYYVNAGKIQNLAGTPDKYSFVFYNKGITASLCSVLNADKNGGFLITNNDFTEQEGYLLCYAGIGGATSGNSVKFTEVMLVEGFLPAPVWTPSFSEQQNKIDAAKDAAEQAKADIAAMNDDNIFDISEKQTTRTTWENINGVASTEFTGTTGSYYKTKLEGSGLPELSALDTAYTNLRTYLNGILLYANSNTENFVRSEMAAKFTAYYDAEIAVNTAIADKLSKDAVGNIKLGGRNLATKSNNFNAGNGNTGITSVRNEDGSITVTAASGNGDWFTGFYAGNYGQIENSMNEGDDFTISFEMKSEDSTRIPNIYVKEGMGYYPMIGNMSSVFSQVYYTGKWKKANNMLFHLGFNGLAGSFTIKNLKVEKGNKPTAWSPAIEDQDEKIDGLQGQITEHTETIAQLQAEDDNIRISVNSVTTKVDETAKKSFGYSWNSGKMMHTDPTFKVGLNGIYIYNNDAAGGASAVTISRITRLSDSPTNDSEYNIKIATLNDKTAPGLGGFTFRTQSRANAIFITRIVAKIPVGYYLNWASNQTGDNEEYYWTTSNKGTGNWEEYIHVIKCGSTGNFGVTNYFYLDGPKNNYPVEWYLAYASVFDVSAGLSTSDQARQESISYTDKKTFSKYVFDLTPDEYDRNTYYPITMLIPGSPATKIKLYIDHNGSGNPEWSTHGSGMVSADCEWTSNGSYWGSHRVERIISDFRYSWSDLTPIGDLWQLANSGNEYVYVRGGAIYCLEITNGVVPVLHTSEFTASNETISLKTSVTAPKVTLEATKETLDAEIVLLKGSITAKVDYATYNEDKAVLENNISQIEVKQGSIEQSVTNIDNRLGLIEGSGLVIEENFATIFSQKKDLLGEDIVSSINVSPGATRIDSAKIEISGQTIFKDSNNNVVNIFGNGDNVLTINGGVFNVDKNGKLTATNAVIKGRIEASEGKIGGFTLENNGLTVGSSINGLTLNPTFFNIKYQNSYVGTVTSKIYAEMGASSTYLTKAPFHFYKKAPSDYYIPTMEIVSENAANINSALRTSGCIVSKNAIIEGGYARVNASEYTTLNLKYGTKYEIYNTVNRNMYFPTVDEVKNWVGSLPASIVIDVVAHHSNSADFRMKWSTGKTIYDWNGGSNSEWVMSKGDSCTFLLVYESVSSYYAQIMQRNS